MTTKGAQTHMPNLEAPRQTSFDCYMVGYHLESTGARVRQRQLVLTVRASGREPARSKSEHIAASWWPGLEWSCTLISFTPTAYTQPTLPGADWEAFDATGWPTPNPKNQLI